MRVIIFCYLYLFAILGSGEDDGISDDAINELKSELTQEEIDQLLGNSTSNVETASIGLFARLLRMMYEIKEKWLDVPLDHFDLFDNRTWRMRYLTRGSFFKPGGPLFVEVGGEWTIDGSSLVMGGLAELAEEHNGFLVETEHRYYGKSLPFGKDFSTEKLRFLQMEQALEDLAYFIEHFKSATPGLGNSTVIIRGCSYPGMLVTWMRVRFPHIVDISYASSAPLGVGLDYPEYFEVVNDVYANVSTNCIETVRRGFNQTMNLLKTDDGRLKVREAFKDWTCGDIDEMNSMAILGKIIVVLNVMHDPSQYEEVACLTMAIDEDELQSFQLLANFIVLKSKHIASCMSGDTDPEEKRNHIAWSYQTCTEMGTFLTLNRKNSRHPFEMDLTVEESLEECGKDFKGLVTENILREGIARVTRRYGGRKPKVTRVVTIQGTHDPWKHLAHLEDYGPEAPVWVVDGSHCSEINAQSEDDSEQVIAVREKVKRLISKWIKEIS
ncbi:hypothetical protein PPYR_05208 [Photinus pyralis]|uniref:Uncharacterized protein n=3 Tax=Photinus pyralis TaxID=7054 RepID=A0A5N4A0Y3_PHOPY|nr:putative serine protease K12H4.7 [Photinus pyralis]XP_031335066.1 putative serine protease K12H4.7 [Photinus pyralis]KAB0790982.1 hypothetical protein PPYR_02782 [Photinus pyralis]KAB0803022.1 hypothetical protein PPYR_05208 [Photinus pyralis]